LNAGILLLQKIVGFESYPVQKTCLYQIIQPLMQLIINFSGNVTVFNVYK